MARKQPACKLTLREAFELHYPKDELAPASLESARQSLLWWERFTKDPPVSKIDNAVLEEFRQAFLKTHAPTTMNSTRAQLRAILRRLAPPFTGNPNGLGLIPSMPYMRPTKVVRGLPRRVTQEDLSRWYIACERMQSPKWGGPPAYWWQAMLVTIYFCGVRKADAFAIRRDSVDFENGTLLFTARKTMKPMRLPLHPCVVEHLKRISEPEREYLFYSSLAFSGNFNHRWNWICHKAGIAEPFTPHDIRRTAASEIERVQPGMAATLLQHSVNDTTHISYLNLTEELAEAIAKMRVPIAFKHGPVQAEKQLAKQQAANVAMMKAAQFSPPAFPDPSEWQFHDVGFFFRGKHVRMEGGALKILRAIALSPLHACTIDELKAAVWPDGKFPGSFRTLQGRICDCISTIRERLRHTLLLPDSFNPVPCIERGNGGRWTLYIPTRAAQDGAA